DVAAALRGVGRRGRPAARRPVRQRRVPWLGRGAGDLHHVRSCVRRLRLRVARGGQASDDAGIVRPPSGDRRRRTPGRQRAEPASRRRLASYMTFIGRAVEDPAIIARIITLLETQWDPGGVVRAALGGSDAFYRDHAVVVAGMLSADARDTEVQRYL